MEKLYVLESGIKRKAEKHNCEYCKKEFLRRKNASSPKKYCSKKCHEINRKNRVIVNCANCNKPVEKIASKLKLVKHGFHFCNRKCKEEAQKLGGKCPQIRPAHFGTGNGRWLTKNLIKNKKNPICVGCGERKRYLLLTHHKDGDRDNNKEDNLEIVCSNCHMKRHLHLKNGKWQYWTQALTSREMLNKL